MEYKRKKIFLRNLISTPLIYSLIIPLVILDIFTEVYHQICFRLYKLPLVKRSNYIRIDRHKLKYLGLINKVGCIYCGYANGLIHYVSEIGARTEKYWCGIQHKRVKGFIAPKHHKDFVKYGDEKAYRKKYL